MHSPFVFAIGVFALLQAVVSQSTTLFFSFTPASVTAGQAATFKYDAPDVSSPVTITLRKGDPSNLETIAVLSTTTTGGTYTWTPSTTLIAGSDYALMITQGTVSNYSPQFALVNSTPATTTTTTSPLTTSSAPLTSSSSSSSAVSMTTSLSVNDMGTTVIITMPCSLSSSSAPYAIGNGTVVAGMATGTGGAVNATFVSPTVLLSSTGVVAGGTTFAPATTSAATSAAAAAATSEVVSTGAADGGRAGMLGRGAAWVLGFGVAAGGLMVFV